LIKEQQQQILDEFERIHITRATNNSKAGVYKKMIQVLSEVLIVTGTRLQKHYHPSLRPALSGHNARPKE
jgi:hypothetical protein